MTETTISDLPELRNADDLFNLLRLDKDDLIGVINGYVLTKYDRRLQKRVIPIWHGILLAFYEAGLRQTVRQVFYKCSVYNVVPKTENGYSQISHHLARMRRCGLVPYEWVTDNTRRAMIATLYADPIDMLDKIYGSYRRDVWQSQSAYVEIWCEKDTLTSILYPVTDAYAVPLMPARGFASETFAEENARALAGKVEAGKDVYIYHFGDLDPSGVAARDDVSKKLRRYSEHIIFTPVAVLPEQIEKWDLPTRPTKQTDSRSKNWEGDSVELEAIPANTLQKLCRDCILKHIDPEPWENAVNLQNQEGDLLDQQIELLIAEWNSS